MASVGACWAPGNSIVLHSAKSAGPVRSVNWDTKLHSPVWRKLVNESAQTFASLQKLAREEDGGSPSLSPAHLLRLSRQYRSVIRDCQEQLDALSEHAAEDAKIDLLGQSELLYKLELIWNLVEVLSIEKIPSGIVLPQLLQWISLHFSSCEERARAVLAEAADDPESHADFWHAIKLFLLHGKMEQARKMLRLHSDFSSDSFVSADELLRKMPLYSPSSAAATSTADFEFRWRHWQTEVATRLDEGDFASNPELTTLVRLMAGSDAAFQAMADECETWYEWMTGKLLFCQPMVKGYELSYHAEQAIGRFGGMTGMTTLDSVLLAAMETDIPQVMHELCTTLDNFWFPAHLLDLLNHSDAIAGGGGGKAVGGGDRGFGESPLPLAELREFLLLDYASCLMSNHSLWQVGVTYLDQCPVQGRYRLELLLDRVPLETESKANKVIGLAMERGLVGTAASACKVMGMRALKDDRIGSAMAWGLRSQDAKFTTFLADKLLEQYCAEGNFSSSDLLDNLGSCMVVSDRLTFLAKYREFHKLCEKSDFHTAATLLHSLLWSRLAPKYFWVTLLIDAQPFLSVDNDADDGGGGAGAQVFFTSEQTYELMHCLQELSSEDSLPQKQRLLLAEHEKQIRMNLAKNLAVALMNEGEAGAHFRSAA